MECPTATSESRKQTIHYANFCNLIAIYSQFTKAWLCAIHELAFLSIHLKFFTPFMSKFHSIMIVLKGVKEFWCHYWTTVEWSVDPFL